MKKLLKKPLAAAYLAAALIWILLFVVSSLQAVWHTLRGNAVTGQVPTEQLELIALVEQKPDEEIGEGNWLVSSDSDPQIRWLCGGKYLDIVELEMDPLWPTGAVALYYRTSGQADFLPDQMVYAEMTEEGVYRFDLGGKVVEQIRIDPASSGGVILQLDGVYLRTSGLSKIIPTFQQLALLLGLPPVAVAVWSICESSLSGRKQTKE